MTAVFYAYDKQVGRVDLVQSEAAAIGKRIAETGVWDDSPISVSPADLKAFGNRLREYGEKGG